MENKKCVFYDFKKGIKENIFIYSYQNGQLDLDLEIEVRCPSPTYKSNILDFSKTRKYKKNGFSREELENPFNIA